MQKIALIGAGTMGRTHANGYSGVSGGNLVAICDPRLDAAQELAAEHSARAYSSVEQMLLNEDIDVVDVCVPTPFHLGHIKTAAEAGKHVICEKPLALASGDAMEAVKVCEDAGVKLFVAHVLRWFPEFRRIHDLVREGAVGRPIMVRTSRASAFTQGCQDWFADMKQSGGVVMDVIIHDFDWLRWCFGNVVRVYARGLYGSNHPRMDYALVSLRFEGGVIAHVEGNWALPTGFRVEVEVSGEEGVISFSSQDSDGVRIESKTPDSPGSCAIISDCPPVRDPYYMELQHFVDCLEGRDEPELTGWDGVEAVRIAEAAIESISTGRPVALAREVCA